LYAYIKGIVTLIKPSYIVVDQGGVGYLIISPNPYGYIINENVTVHTHHYVREDINNLYGFTTLESKELFIKLIGVSGIGPKSALSILASDKVDEIIYAIEEGNTKYLQKFPGIGMKSAQQIILDLKGKLVDADTEIFPTQSNDVEDALTALGYSKNEIRRVMKIIDHDQPVEKMIKDALAALLK
jgi:holliday junction DNA helicase RuvA